MSGTMKYKCSLWPTC